MLTRNLRITSGLLGLGALAMYAGCTTGNRTTSDADEPARHEAAPPPALADWPENAVEGQCYARVFVPAKLRTFTQQVCVREASERTEITPAQYEWVEERIMVKDPSVQLVEVPAEYKSQDQVMEVAPGKTDWIMKSCSEGGQAARDVFCYVTSAPVQKTVQTTRLVTATSTREVPIPAEYQTIRRQKLAAAATTRKIAIPAEYTTVEKSVALAAGHMEWQRVMCDSAAIGATANAVKTALLAAGYVPGPLNGELGDQDWAAIKSYQAANGLGVGSLSYETLEKLQVAAK